MKKKRINKDLIKILILILIVGILFNHFNNLSIIGTIGTNSVSYVSEDPYSVTYSIVTSSSQGSFIQRSSANPDGIINGLGFGDTIIAYTVFRSDDLQEGKRDVVSKNYDIDSSSVKFNGLKAIKNYQTGNEIELEDVRAENIKGYCRPFGSSNADDINCPGTKIAGETNSDSTSGRAQSFGCVITSGKLKAYENGVAVTNVNFYGISSIKVEVKTLKQGIQCTEDQLTNCAENQICVANKCIDKSGDIIKTFYRLSEGICNPIQLSELDKTDNDYNTLTECLSTKTDNGNNEEDIGKNNKLPSSYKYVFGILLLILGVFLISKEIKKSNRRKR